MITKAHDDKADLANIEKALLEVLESDATPAGKQFVCRRLSIIGADPSIPTLANNESLEAFNLASDYLDDPALRMEAEFAVVKIAQVISGDCPQQATNVLKRIVQTTKNDSLRRQAQEIIKQIQHIKDIG